jgi:hypothetical protein
MSSTFSLRKLFSKGSGGAMRSPREVKPGMRYQQTRQLGSVWVVKRMVNTLGNDLPHAMIVREEVESDTRVISVSALLDKHFFQYVPPKENPETGRSTGE